MSARSHRSHAQVQMLSRKLILYPHPDQCIVQLQASHTISKVVLALQAVSIHWRNITRLHVQSVLLTFRWFCVFSSRHYSILEKMQNHVNVSATDRTTGVHVSDSACTTVEYWRNDGRMEACVVFSCLVCFNSFSIDLQCWISSARLADCQSVC